MTIEQLEALEKAATAGPCELFNDEWTCAIKVGEVYMQAPYQPPHGRGECAKWRADGAVFAAARTALPALLAVAKAAQKSLDQLSYILEVAHNEQQDEVLYPNMLAEIGTRREELREALSRLEAQ